MTDALGPAVGVVACGHLGGSSPNDLTLFDDSSPRSLKLAYDGLEREFNFFNWLEGGVCTTCALRDQRKTSDDQREQPS